MNPVPNSDLPAEKLLELATGHHGSGDRRAARALYEQVLQKIPGQPLALFRLGLLELQSGAPAVALGYIDRAIAIQAHDPVFHLGRGQVLSALGRLEEAAEAFECAVHLDPQRVEALERLGNARRLTGNLPAAESSYRRILELEPDHAAATSDLGTLLMESGRLPEAFERLQAAHALQPRSTLAAVNLAILCCRQRRFADAEQLLRGPFDDAAHLPAVDFNLGIALAGQGRADEAVAAYRRVLSRHPDHGDALLNLGNALDAIGDPAAALSAYESALALAPRSAAALNNLGCLLRRLGRLDEAAERLRLALDSEPWRATLHNNLANVLKDLGDIDAAIESFRRTVALDPDDPVAHGNLAYALGFQSDDPGRILAECRRWNERFGRPLAATCAPHPNDPSPDRALRVGYVSPDFRDHCQTLFTLPVLREHDHGAFEIYGYSSVARPDALTGRIAALTDVFRVVRDLDDAELCARIRADRIDILVDLTMHMAGGRPLLFARRPAPLQITWLAYPGTTGLDTFDYRLTDPRLDPIGSAGEYSERSAWLPDSFWVYDPLSEQPRVGPLPALERGDVTFGCLNNPCKVTETSLRLWSRVLHALPGSRLKLLAPPGSARVRTLERLGAFGLDPHRVSFVPYQPRARYLDAYHDIDLGLDTLPYNGHTTSLDSLWMGVPVVSRLGTTCVGRGGFSQLFQLGLTELVARTDQEFVDTAVRLASDLPQLAALRAQLRQRLERSALMDAKRFTRNLEQLYRRAWEEYCGVV